MAITDMLNTMIAQPMLDKQIEQGSEDIRTLKSLDSLKDVKLVSVGIGDYLGDAVYGVTYQAKAATEDIYSDPQQFLIDIGLAKAKKEIEMVPVRNKGKPDEYRPLTFTIKSLEGPVQLNLMLFNPDYGKPAEQAPAQPAAE